ncbi:hypothetical protein GF1_06540 [Desulfolithobacter dissulfuricans]|uniref:Uncharacterized protein n=1 Tax=Desulfolithobacter dissulfuricans TaxID=2795293 RepID=A0A915XJS7_9BACT|nr:hypothetical protein GF1_06540 [Desulfolithobacter dissulfuricans]
MGPGMVPAASVAGNGAADAGNRDGCCERRVTSTVTAIMCTAAGTSLLFPFCRGCQVTGSPFVSFFKDF